MKQPVAVDGVQGAAPPRFVRELVKPWEGYVALYEISAVLMVRNEPTADDSLADIRARIRFGMAIAAMIRMMATTISSSISEKPFCFRISIFPRFFSEIDLVTGDAVDLDVRSCWAKIVVTLVLGELRAKALFSAGGNLACPVPERLG